MSFTTPTTSSTTSPSSIKVIVSIHENAPIEFKFLAERLNWDNLVALIQSSSTVTPPVILYYKTAFDGPVESLENQEQLVQLLNSMDLPHTLRFYGNADQVIAPIFVSSTAAFTRLGALVDQHKEMIQYSPRITRWIGILASMMAVQENKAFDHEFQVLEKMIEKKTRKMQRRRQQGPQDNAIVESDGVLSANEDEEFKDATTETPEVVDLDSRLEGLHLGGGRGGRHCGRRGGKFGHGFGRHGPYGMDGFPFSEGEAWFGRGHHGPYHFMEGSSDEEPWFGRRGHHHGHHGKFGGRGGKFGRCGGRGGPSSDSEGEAFFGRRGGKHHHHHGRPYPFGGPLGSDEEFSGRHHHHHHGRGFGPRGPPPPFDSEDEGFCKHRGFGGPGFGPRGPPPPPPFDSEDEGFCKRGGRGGRGFGHRGPPPPPPFGAEHFFGGRHGFGGRHHHPWGKFGRPDFSDNEDGSKKEKGLHHGRHA